MVRYCEDERPPRDVICQKAEGHTGKHRAVIFWEDSKGRDPIESQEVANNG